MPPTNLMKVKRPIGTVAYISGKTVDEPFMWSFAQLLCCCNEYICPPGHYIHPDHSTGSNQILGRNELVKKMQGDWLMQVDTDHVFEPDLLLRLLQLFESHNLDVLAGLYHFKQPPHNPILFQYQSGKYNAVLNWGQREEVKLIPIGATGAGCLLVRRRVFEAMRQRFHGEEPFDQFPPYKYDDFNFFERCRVMGIASYCAPQIEALHLGLKGYGSEDYNPATFEPNSSIECEVRI